MATPRLLITGAGGFVGTILLKALHETPIFARARYQLWYNQPVGSGAMTIDIRQADAVAAAVAAFRPSHVVHLAAQSHVPTSFVRPDITWQVNVMGTLNLFEALKHHAPHAGVLFISTSEVYGASFKAGQPLNESALLQPTNPYAASKAAADLMSGQYAAGGLRIIRLRPFNHIGPGQREDFVASAFAAQIARIEGGRQQPVVRVGNLEAQRDFLAVDDIVRAYVLALEQIEQLPPGLILNLCSGQPCRIAELLAILLQQARCPITVETDPGRLRPSDTPIAVGCGAAARQHLGWHPRISLTQVLGTLLDHWRKKAPF